MLVQQSIFFPLSRLATVNFFAMEPRSRFIYVIYSFLSAYFFRSWFSLCHCFACSFVWSIKDFISFIYWHKRHFFCTCVKFCFKENNPVKEFESVRYQRITISDWNDGGSLDFLLFFVNEWISAILWMNFHIVQWLLTNNTPKINDKSFFPFV